MCNDKVALSTEFLNTFLLAQSTAASRPNMKSLPATRARHVSNFANTLATRGIPVEGYLARSHLPVELLESENHEQVLSAVSMLRFADDAAADTGFADLGLYAGAAPIGEFGYFGGRVIGEPTLHTALRTFCNTAINECSIADYYLSYSGSKVWFCHGRANGEPLGSQHELYALMIMIQVIRLSLGPQWKPARIRLQRHCEKGIVDNEFLASANIELGATQTGIEFNLFALATHLNNPQNVRMDYGRNAARNRSAGLPGNFRHALREIVTIQLCQSTYASIDDAAEMAGVSTRSLQRRLRSEGTSYSDIVDQVRMDIAIPLLIDGSVSITEMANQMGYNNVSNFSRAFSRLTGMSPRYFRVAVKNGA